MSENVKLLENKLRLLKNPDTKEGIDIRNELAWELGYSDLKRGYELSKTAYEYSKKKSYKYGLAFSKLNMGFYYYTQPDFASALKHCRRALKIFMEINNKNQQGNTLSILGLIYWSLGNFGLAFEKLHESESIFKETKNDKRLPWTLTTLGGIYHSLGDYKKALDYQIQSLTLFRKTHNKLGEARSLTGIGSVYQNMKKYDDALLHQKASLVLFKELGSNIGVSRTYNDMGVVYQNLGAYEKSLKYHNRSLKIREKLNNKNIELTSLLNLGKLYVEMKRPDDALNVLLKALKFAREFDSRPKLYKVHKVLAEVYEQKNNLKKALHHLKAHQEVKEDVFNNEMSTKLKNAEIQHEVEKSEKEAEIHRLKNIELKQALDNLRVTQVQLIESEKMAALGQFTAGITHEINNPVAAVKSSADLLKRGLVKVQQLLQSADSFNEILENKIFKKTVEMLSANFDIIDSAIERISTIVRSLKVFTRIDEAQFKKADIHKGLDSVIMLLGHELKRGVKIVKEYGNLPKIYHYPYQMNQVFLTLLRNANQAVDNNGVIVIKTCTQGNNICITISDNGKGIPENVRRNLFELNFKSNHSRISFGLGMFNAYTIIKKHNGSIIINSAEGKGSEFIITLPQMNSLVF